MSENEQSEIKLMLTAILEQLRIQGAKIEAMQHDGREFRREFNTFRSETSERFDKLDEKIDFLAGKLGQHDMDIHLLKLKNL